MMVQRGSILQRAMPRGITIQRTIALVVALAKLHNCCIHQQEEQDLGLLDELPNENADVHNYNDLFFLDQLVNEEAVVPTELLGGGEHFDDYPYAIRRTRNVQEQDQTLPRYKSLQKVIESHMVRPHVNVIEKINKYLLHEIINTFTTTLTK